MDPIAWFFSTVLHVAVGQSSTPVPAATSTPRAMIWDGPPATSYDLDVRPLDLSADGEARVLVRAILRDANGRETHLRKGGDFDFFADHGRVQWQTRLRFGGPAAIVRVRDERPLSVRVVANVPHELGTRRTVFDVRRARLAGAVARAVGPYEVRVGWFPLTGGPTTVRRSGALRGLAVVPKGTTSHTDAVKPGDRVTYRIERTGQDPVTAAVDAPAALPPSSVNAVRGKGVWLAFSGSTVDDDAYTILDPDAVADRLARSGVKYVLLRLTYGEFWQITPDARETVDRLIDRLADRGIATVGWTVPREPSAEDLALNVAAAAYRTPAGHGVTGLAVDLERGEEYLGTGASGYAALGRYLSDLRAAIGPGILLVATVEDPFLEHLDARSFPYDAIARAADVVQPMTYWRMARGMTTPDAARAAVAGSLAALRRLGAARVVNVGALGGDLGNGTGAPGPAEISAAVDEARRRGAIGATLYDWRGTSPEGWDALAQTPW